MDINILQQGSINLRIKGGVGNIHMSVPHNAAVHLISSSGLGNVKVLPNMQRVSSTRNSAKGGTFETPDFNNAKYQISVDYDAGIGTFNMDEGPLNTK